MEIGSAFPTKVPFCMSLTFKLSIAAGVWASCRSIPPPVSAHSTRWNHPSGSHTSAPGLAPTYSSCNLPNSSSALVSHCKNHKKPVFMMLVCLFSIMMLFSFCVKPASILKVYASCWISGSLASIMLPICNFGNCVRNVGYHGRQPKIHQASRSWCFGSVSNSDEESYLSRSTCFGSFHEKEPRINGWV